MISGYAMSPTTGAVTPIQGSPFAGRERIHSDCSNDAAAVKLTRVTRTAEADCIGCLLELSARRNVQNPRLGINRYINCVTGS
jgi:hypothetical protein